MLYTDNTVVHGHTHIITRLCNNYNKTNYLNHFLLWLIGNEVSNKDTLNLRINVLS